MVSFTSSSTFIATCLFATLMGQVLAAPTKDQFVDDKLPKGWKKLKDNKNNCYVDNPTRILSNVITTVFNNLTPSSCASYCESTGFRLVITFMPHVQGLK